MDCTAIRPLISYYYDGEATPEERAQVELHLAGCEDCRRVLAQYRTISSDIRDMPMPTPPVGLHRDVWRAIEAQQASIPRWKQQASTSAPKSKVVDISTAQRQKRPTLPTVLTNMGSGWARALPAALLVAALGIMIAVFIFIQGRVPSDPAKLVEAGPFSNYGQVLQVLFSKQVYPDDAITKTSIYKIQASKEYTVGTTNTFSGQILSIKPQDAWEAGATYQIRIDAPNIRLGGLGSGSLDNKVIALNFSTVANTPTPTDTPVPPTATPNPTDTPVPTPQPTQVVENTSTPEPTAVVPTATTQPIIEPSVVASNTPRPQPTSTSKPAPSSTPVPPSPSATPTHEPAATPTQPVPTPTSPHPGTPTATPGQGSPTPYLPTPTPTSSVACGIMPVNGFGKIWTENLDVRQRVGCPVESEYAITNAVQERFEGGYMFWRQDIKKIYVFIGNPNAATAGTWSEYDDTWQEGDPMPTPEPSVIPGVRGSATPPAGKYAPVRGFGKLWYSNLQLRDMLGWALEPEQPVTGAFQTFEHGYALWTDNKVIRFMFKDNIWERFTDTFVIPTPSATPR